MGLLIHGGNNYILVHLAYQSSLGIGDDDKVGCEGHYKVGEEGAETVSDSGVGLPTH